MNINKQIHTILSMGSIPLMGLTLLLSFGFSNSPAPLIPSENIPQADSVHMKVEQLPQFIGSSPMQWISKQVRYPVPAMEKGIQGKVYVSFIIEKDGSVSNFKIAKGIDPLLDAEALRVISLMPKWAPGSQDGKPVRVSYTMPISFQLGGSHSSTDSHENYLKSLDRIAEMLNNLDRHTKPDTYISSWVKETTNDQDAYDDIMKKLYNIRANRLGMLRRAMEAERFPKNKKREIEEMYAQKATEQYDFIKTTAVKNFIRTFSKYPRYELIMNGGELMVTLRKNLSPEDFKKLTNAIQRPSKQDPNTVYSLVEKMPEFLNGDIQTWIADNLKNTQQEEANVLISFIVEKDGTLSTHKIVRGASSQLDAEAMRVVKAMPRWAPGMEKGQPVKVVYTLPIHFGQTTNNTSETQKNDSINQHDIFDHPEELPKFKQGSVQKWIAKNIKYPKRTPKDNVARKIFVQFTIEIDGSISDPKIIKGSDPRFAPEAIRVIQKMPKWEPGKLKGKPVRTNYVLPIVFQS